MKIHYILSLAAAGLLLASCAKENMETPKPGVGDSRASFTAAVEGSDATRTELGVKDGESYPTLWLAGDRIAVTDGTNTGTYETQSDKAQTAVFAYVSGTELAAGAGLYAACYPASAHSSYSAGTFRAYLPTTQTYKAGNIDNGAYPMVAVASDTNLQFRNVCGIVRLRLTTTEPDLKVESVVLKSQTPLSGEAEIAYAGTGDPALSCNGSKTVKLECGSGVALGSDPTDFHISLPPNAAGYADLEITVNLSGNRVRTFTANTPIKVERSKITTISLAVNNPSGKALLQTGQKFAAAVKTLAAGSDTAYNVKDMLVKDIKFVTGSADPKQAGEVEIQDEASAEPVYLSWDAGLGLVTVRTPAEAIAANKDASYMFYYFSAISGVNVSGLDTSNVTDMNQMFGSCLSLAVLDLSGFDTSKVSTMFRMFSSCMQLSALDLNGFNTSNALKMEQMFSGCVKLSSLKLGREFVMDGVSNKSSMCANLARDVENCTITCTEPTKSALSDESTNLDATKITWYILN